jgi:hypothetical protein
MANEKDATFSGGFFVVTLLSGAVHLQVVGLWSGKPQGLRGFGLPPSPGKSKEAILRVLCVSSEAGGDQRRTINNQQ